MKKLRIGIQQRVLPSYRIPFFDFLAGKFPGGLSVFAGDPRKEEGLHTNSRLERAQFAHGKNIHLFDGKFYMCWQAGLLNWVRDWQPDVLIMEANPRYVTSRAAIHWMRVHGGKVIGWGLGSPKPEGSLTGLRLLLRRRFVHKLDALITYSLQGANEYAQLGIDPNRIFTAPNAVAPKPQHELPKRPKTYRAGKPAVLFVGRLQPRKRVDLLIRACAKLREYAPLLWIVGDGPYRHTLEDLAAKEYPQTRFYGAKHGKELEKLMRRADIFVLPGTGGLAVQQAMAYGLPVIVGESDGTQSDLVRHENGWVLPEANAEILAKFLSEALSDLTKLRQMGRVSFQIVREDVNLEKMAAAFMRAIKSVKKN